MSSPSTVADGLLNPASPDAGSPAASAPTRRDAARVQHMSLSDSRRPRPRPQHHRERRGGGREGRRRTGGAVPEGEAKRSRAVARAIIAAAEASEILRTLARWSAITDRVAAG